MDADADASCDGHKKNKNRVYVMMLSIEAGSSTGRVSMSSSSEKDGMKEYMLLGVIRFRLGPMSGRAARSRTPTSSSKAPNVSSTPTEAESKRSKCGATSVKACVERLGVEVVAANEGRASIGGQSMSGCGVGGGRESLEGAEVEDEGRGGLLSCSSTSDAA